MWRVAKIPSMMERLSLLKSVLTRSLGWSGKDKISHLPHFSLDGIISDYTYSSASDMKSLKKENHILTGVLGWNGKDKIPHLPHFNVGGLNGDSSSPARVKSLKKTAQKLRSEIQFLKKRDYYLRDILDRGVKYMKGASPPCILYTPEKTYDHLPKDYCKDAFMIFEKMLERKIASEGEDFIRVDSRPSDLLVRMDMEELKKKYHLVLDYDYIYFIQLRIILLQRCKAIETCYKLMEFFAENYYPGIIIEWVERDKAELDKIIRGTVTTDALVLLDHGMDSLLISAFRRYSQLCIKEGAKVESNERLAMVKVDRDKSLFDAKKWYRGIILRDLVQYAGYVSMNDQGPNSSEEIMRKTFKMEWFENLKS